LTQQSRSREWAAAPSAATHIPHSPASGNSWHGSDAGSNTTSQTPSRPRTRPTHAHGWAGGCCVVGAPTRSTLGPPRRGPEPARRGGYRRPFGRPPPHATERVRLPRRQAREFADATKPDSRFPESDAGRATRVRRALPPPPFAPPGDSPPLSTRAVPAAPLSVTRDTRREGTRAPLLTPRSARRTRRSHNTHSGSSLSSSSLRGGDLHTVDTTERSRRTRSRLPP